MKQKRKRERAKERIKELSYHSVDFTFKWDRR